MQAGDGYPRGWTPTQPNVPRPPWPDLREPPPQTQAPLPQVQPSQAQPAQGQPPQAQPPQARPPEARPPQAAPKPVRRTWWIAPFLGGALAVLAVTAILQLTVLHHSAGQAHAAASLPATSTRPAPPPAQVFPDVLFKKLTQDIQTQNEAGFLSLVSPGARPEVRIWWENLQAIGFTTGAILPTASGDRVDLNSHGDGTATVLAGVHNALDPRDSNGKPDIPSERYQIGLHFAGPGAIGEITSWKPLGDDPWDQGVRLYVRKAANVVVAGPQADRGLVDETLPIAQAAAGYDVGLVNQVNSHDLHQLGFVVFVSGNSAVRDRWFSTGPRPAGWPPAFFGGLTVPLPGPGASADSSVSGGDVSDGSTGGARVVITPFEDESGGTSHLETVQLVHQFMLDILAADDQALAPGGSPPAVPSWAVEGLAVAVQSLYEGNTNPAPGTYSFTPLDDELKALPSSYRDGSVPTSQQLFTGPTATEENWNDVAASVYEYIAVTHGINQMLAAATLLWTNQTSPFGNVLASSSNGNFNFFAAATIESGWRAALAKI